LPIGTATEERLPPVSGDSAASASCAAGAMNFTVLTSRAKVEQVEKTHARLKIRVENQRGENVLVGVAMIRTSDS